MTFRILAQLGAGIVRLWPAKIRWKIVAPYVVLTLIVAAAGTFFATRLVTGSLADRFDNQLAEAARVASDAVVRRERQHLETVRAVSFTVGVSEVLLPPGTHEAHATMSGPSVVIFRVTSSK